MPRRLLAAVSLFVLTFIAGAQTPPPSAKSAAEPLKLPVRRIVLYRNGVGYFEHMGRIRGNQDLSIDFTTAQLNDVLKSLTVVDMGEGRISGVRYDSTAPLSERLRTLRLPIGDDTGQTELLRALRGARVEVRSGTTSAVGKILSVETRNREDAKGGKTETTDISIVSDAGEIRTFQLGPATSVKILERDLTQEVGRYLDLVGSTRSRDLRRMVISSTGSGERDLYVGYISEVPVWKSTYRLLLPTSEKAKPRLQGWAIVDNTIGEDWNGVQLTLVAGSPQSFVQEISRPYYTRRPVVPLPESVMLTPQSHEGTMDDELHVPRTVNGVVGGVPGGVPGGQMLGVTGGIMARSMPAPAPPPNGLVGQVLDPTGATVPNAVVTFRNTQTGTNDSARTDSNGYYRFYNVPSGPMTVTATAMGFHATTQNLNFSGGRSLNFRLNVGSTAETVEVTADASPSEDMLAEAFEAAASGSNAADLFRYELKEKITIGKNQSALVPIINSAVEAEKVTLWNASGDGEDHVARRAVWLKNTSGLTLDAGTFSVLEGETFAGEGLIEPLKPAERRLVSYAADTAVRIASKGDSKPQPVTAVRIAKGVMMVERGERRTTEYTVRNADEKPRDVIVEHPVESGWKLAGDAKPEESSASAMRFRVKVEPNKTSKLVVEEYQPQQSTYALSTLTPDQVLVFVQERTIPPQVEQDFQRVLAKKNEITVFERDIRSREQEVNTINTDQNRLRENMKALKGSAEEKALLQRYTRQLDQQEDRLAALRTEVEAIRGKREHAASELDSMIEQIDYRTPATKSGQ
jgi:hypothetical protein